MKMKGFQRLIPLLRYLPEVDLRIAGTGPYEPELRALARNLPNVHFRRGFWEARRWPVSFAAPGRWSSHRFSPRLLDTSCSRRSR